MARLSMCSWFAADSGNLLGYHTSKPFLGLARWTRSLYSKSAYTSSLYGLRLKKTHCAVIHRQRQSAGHPEAVIDRPKMSLRKEMRGAESYIMSNYEIGGGRARSPIVCLTSPSLCSSIFVTTGGQFAGENYYIYFSHLQHLDNMIWLRSSLGGPGGGVIPVHVRTCPPVFITQHPSCRSRCHRWFFYFVARN